MSIWRRGVLLGGGGRQIVIAFFGSFFFFFSLSFGWGVGKTGLSGLSPSPLVPGQLGVGAAGVLCKVLYKPLPWVPRALF